jgi:hypothetical protein
VLLASALAVRITVGRSKIVVRIRDLRSGITVKKGTNTGQKIDK